MAAVEFGIGTAIKTVAEIIKSYPNGNLKDYSGHAQDLGKSLSLISTNGSITKLLSKFIVEPVIITSSSIRDMDASLFDKLLQVNTDIFCSFYLQAFKILNEQYGINATSTVNLLSTDRGTIDKLTLENDKTYIEQLFSKDTFLKVSMEASNESNMKIKGDKLQSNNGYQEDPLYTLLNRSLEITIDVSNNGVKKSIIIPITVRAHVVITNINAILNMLSPNARDKTFSYRLDEYRAGAISLSELLFASDLIKKYKQNKIKDKDDLLELINSRILSSSATAIAGGKAVGYEKNYNMLMVTADEKIKLDKHIGGDLFKEKYKQQLLEQSHAMTISIVDEDYERVTILTRDIRGNSTVGFKSIKNRKDKDNSGFEEILKSIFMSKPISF